jgi:hypothetical protein
MQQVLRSRDMLLKFGCVGAKWRNNPPLLPLKGCRGNRGDKMQHGRTIRIFPLHSPTCCSHVLQMAHRIILLAPFCTCRLCIHLHAWRGSSGISYIPNTCSNPLSTHDDAMRQCDAVLDRHTRHTVCVLRHTLS